MRKIETQNIIDARNQKNKKLLTVLMLVILLGSTAGYAFMTFEQDNGSNGGSQNSDGQYQNAAGRWAVNVSGQDIYLSNSKIDVQNISVLSYSGLGNYYNKPLYVSSDSDSSLQEIGSTIGLYASRTQQACYGPCNKNLPEKNCTDNLIVFRANETLKVSQSENCIFIDGNLRSVDAFLYKVLGS